MQKGDTIQHKYFGQGELLEQIDGETWLAEFSQQIAPFKTTIQVRAFNLLPTDLGQFQNFFSGSKVPFFLRFDGTKTTLWIRTTSPLCSVFHFENGKYQGHTITEDKQ